MAGQSKKKLKNLLEKAEELFFKYGYNAVSLDRIAADAGISKMTIYNHFRSKEDLFVEVMKKNIEYHVDKIVEKINEKYHTIEKIESLYNYSMNLSKQYPIIVFKDVIERKSIFERVAAIKLEKTLPIWRYILEDGIGKKEIRDLDVDFVSELLMNLPLAIKNLDFLTDKSKQLKLYESFFDFIKYGLLGGVESRQQSEGKEGSEGGEKHADENR